MAKETGARFTSDKLLGKRERKLSISRAPGEESMRGPERLMEIDMSRFDILSMPSDRREVFSVIQR